MSWWLRAHRAHLPVITAVAGSFMAWLAGAGVALDATVGSPLKVGVAVPVVLWWPVAVVGSVCASLAVDDGRLERGMTARANGQLEAWFVAAVVAGAGAGLVPAALVQTSAALAVARTTAGLVGLALVLRRRFGSDGAAVVVAAYFVTCALLGAGPDGDAAWWAWPVAELDLVDTALAAGLLALGLTVTAARPGMPGPRRALG
ncbi:MAG: hypothetical protein JWO77_2843 [Ilumatobacteraceae bacterium]|nr:hypothetical protein [Ilumatobacteraceae bacterium]